MINILLIQYEAFANCNPCHLHIKFCLIKDIEWQQVLFFYITFKQVSLQVFQNLPFEMLIEINKNFTCLLKNVVHNMLLI